MAKLQRALVAIAALVGVGAWFQPAVAGSDLWWHLAAGREILAERSVPTTDHFSFTFSGQPWMHHEWLWGVGYWLVYSVTPEAVAVANYLLLVAVFALWGATAWRHTGDGLASALALWAAAATCYWFLDIRPHEVTLLFVGVVVATRDWPRAPWLWAPLVVLWCNLHGGFVFGFGAIGLLALVQTAEGSLAAGRVRVDPTPWLGVAAAALAFLCNPWGWRILEYPAAYLDSTSPFRSILEWQEPPFPLKLPWIGGPYLTLGLQGLVGIAGTALARTYRSGFRLGRAWNALVPVLLIGFGCATAAILDVRWFNGRFFWLLGLATLGAGVELDGRFRHGRAGGDVYLMLLAGVACAMAVTSRRFIPLFALTSLPLVARLFAAGLGAARQLVSESLRPRAELAAAALALVVALATWRDVRLFPKPLERWTESHLYPRAALRYAQALQPGTRVLNFYNWGGYLMLHAPEFKLFIDGRANTIYSEKLYNDYVEMINILATPDRDSRMGFLAGRLLLYQPDFALLPSGSGTLADALTDPRIGWQLVYIDDAAAVLLPPNSPRLREPLPDPETVVGDDPQWLVAMAQISLSRGDSNGARELCRRALASESLLPLAYGRLALAAATEHDEAGIAAAIERGIAVEPRFEPPLRQQEARAFELVGNPRRALEALERAVPRGPFSRPEGVLESLDRLRGQLAQR
jgi:hypothetical protein